MYISESELEERFRELSVAELLNGEYLFHFEIPSFQRGYRWERKQVEDLLDDIYSFSLNEQTSYFLQPLVIKKANDKWEILDGQQRLTTMLLILMKVISRVNEDDRDEYIQSLYDITYKIRPELDFKNPDFKKTIDGFYLAEAKGTIDRWFEKKKKAHISLSKFQDCLLDPTAQKKVKFIWYAISKNSTELNSINVFNRLNKGKIGLTSSELIKALFVLDFEERDTNEAGLKDETASDQLVMTWNEMEKKFQDDRFWFFISNDKQNVQTRIDLLFDFLTEKPADADADYSYRQFQNLFDACHSASVELNEIWSRKKISSMNNAWKEIKKTFDRLISWYEENSYYHYIGFLVSQRSSPIEISTSLQKAKEEKIASNPQYEWTKNDNISHLRTLISKKFLRNNKVLTIPEIDKLEYSNRDDTILRRLLLLFNIELCIKTGNQRFKFDKYKTENWDIEHVDSQNNSCLQKPEERINWLRDICQILKKENSTSSIAKELLSYGENLLAEFDKIPEGERKFSDELYFKFYEKVNMYFSFDPDAGDKSADDVDLSKKDKNNINNLTLLNSAINRSYKDAPFPFKRYYILNQDKNGSFFIPIGTRNLFMKYYSSENVSAPLELLRWNEKDKQSYLNFIHSIVDSYFTTE